jgi:uncharacterized protein
MTPVRFPPLQAARRARPAAAAVGALGVAGLAWSLVEARSYRLRQVEVPVLASGQRPLRVLHLSDLHMTPGQRAKQEWVRGLARLQPDLVVDTGDNLASPEAVPAVLHALGPLLDRPGVFVPGSNDYHGPVPKNPAGYLFGYTTVPARAARLPWGQLRAGFRDAGWIDLTNATATLEIDRRRVAFAGTDDPHLGRDVLGDVPPPPTDVDLAMGVTHAPYQRVLDHFQRKGYPLLLAGHTHGGQLCIPGWGALVTNCDLDPRRASGLSRHPARGDDGAAWLHVSAGLGTSPYTPVRFACAPEATLLTLVPR